MTYNIGIFADEYLTLLELISSIEREIPTASLTVYGGEELLSTLPAESMDYFAKNIEDLLSTDLMILLAKLPDEKAIFSKYDGTILYNANTKPDSDYDDIIFIEDPLIAILNDIVAANDDTHINIGLPLAVYGREGVDTLMQETRSIYTFDSAEGESLLPMSTAFNIHFYRDALPAGKWAQQIAALRKGASISLRINPVSTVFIVDIFSSDRLVLPSDYDYYTPNIDFSLTDVNSDHKLALITSDDGKMCSIIGDYLHITTQNLLTVVKSALGGVN